MCDRDSTVDPCCDNVVGLVFGDLWPAIIFNLCFVYFDHKSGSASTHQNQDFPRMTQQNLPVMSSADQDLMRNWANTHGKCVRQRTVRQETTKYKAGTLSLNMYQTAVHRGERLEFAPVERVEQPEFSKEEGREGAPTSRDPGDDQLSEYDDDSSDNDSDDFGVEEYGAIRDMQNDELGFLFASRRTRSGRIVKTTNKALLWT